MKKLLAMILSGVGVLAAGAATTACVVVLIDDPCMNAKMIER